MIDKNKINKTNLFYSVIKTKLMLCGYVFCHFVHTSDLGKKRMERESRDIKVDVSSVRERLIRHDRDSVRCERLLHSNQYSTHTRTNTRVIRGHTYVMRDIVM